MEELVIDFTFSEKMNAGRRRFQRALKCESCHKQYWIKRGHEVAHLAKTIGSRFRLTPIFLKANLKVIKWFALSNRGDDVYLSWIREDEDVELSDTETDSFDMGYNYLSATSDDDDLD